MVESLVTEYGTEIPLLYRALLNVCGGDYAEAARRIEEGKQNFLKTIFFVFYYFFFVF